VSRDRQYTGREVMSLTDCCAVIIGHVVGMYPHKLTSHQMSIQPHPFLLVTLLASDAKGNRRVTSLC
jgi:hypothetical protein